MAGRFSLYGDISVEENLRFFASVFGTTLERERDRIAPIYVQLEAFRDRRAAALSGGMKQKLALCCALVHRPEVLFLDEPTTGVDAVSRREFWDLLAPSQFAERTDALFALARSIGFRRGGDPLTTLQDLMTVMYREFEYCALSTRVDSSIDEALEARRGVCQDFSHIFIALARHVGIPTRYVSGYLFRDASGADRSADGATHAWAEALMPGIGWVGFDPTNNVIARERHIRVAIGRDYADVPPTRGVYKGVSAVRTELAVSVRIGPVRSAHDEDAVPFTPWMSRDATVDPRDAAADQQQQ